MKIFKELLNYTGISFRNRTLKQESKGDTIQVSDIEKMMGSLKPGDALAKETRLKAAEGNVWRWAKTALNVWGKRCGISNQSFQIMHGDAGKRRWCIAGVPLEKNKTKRSPYDQMLERLYMSWRHNLWFGFNESDFKHRTQRWKY